MTVATPELALRSHSDDWNRERWEQLPDDGNRYEVIDGVLYMTTAPSYFHQWIIRQIVRVLFQQVDDTGVGLTTWAPIGLFMPGCDPVQPDIVVVPTSNLDIIYDRRISGIPALLVEVLSPANAENDLYTKRRAYAQAGVPEYWIVRPAERDMLVCSQPDTAMGDYAQTDHILPDGELISPTLPVHTPIAGFFASAPDTAL
ncbi:MAG: Uma2 family endonuclease [Chloroflexota bacterium]